MITKPLLFYTYGRKDKKNSEGRYAQDILKTTKKVSFDERERKKSKLQTFGAPDLPKEFNSQI